ncbi:MAG: chromosome segregation protein SMC, partial [Alicyclobacillaceae bacterium]|nr:chromosome segregation protein SMC [Alicyclobacillaceae bacterium]
RARLEGLRGRRAALAGELDRLRLEAEEAARVVEAHEQQLRKMDPGIEAEEERRTRERLEQLKGDLIDRLNRAAAARNEFRHRQEALEMARSRRERLQAEVIRRREEMVAAESQAAQAEKKVAEAEREWHAREQKRQDLLRRLEQVSRDAREVESRWRRDREQLASLSSKWDVMRELEETYGGYGRGAKAVLQAAKSGKLSGVCGAVAELIQVPEGLEVAVETALGPAVQHVVVQEENDGRRAIEFLKTLREGRVTCIPLSVIRPRNMPEEDRRTLASLNGWIGVAADLVEAETAYRHLVENLLGQVVIARDLRAALEMARRTRHRYRIVTLDGDVVHPGGTMSGGAPARSGSNLLARRRQLEQMRRDVEQLQRRVDELGARFGHLEREKEDLFRQKEEVEASLEAAEGELRERQERLQRVLAETKSLRERLDWDLFELGRLESEIAELEARLNEAEEECRIAEQEAQETREEIGRLEAKWQAVQADAERRRAEVTELRVNLASLKERYLYVTEQQREKASQLASVDAESDALEEEVNRLERERAETVRTLEEMSDRLNRRREEAAKWIEKIEGAREARRRAADFLKEAEERVAGLREIWRKCEQQLHSWAVRRERLQVELRHALDALAEHFRLGFERAKERFAPVEDPAPLQRRLDVLRRQMDGIGPVRTGAVEDYERLRERLDFLQHQRDDLLAASARLDEVIRDMDAEMSARFLKTVEAVNARFQDVFVHLFGGGRAYLELTDPADPLGTGVEIIAQPPGKKLQTLSLLSGGERALTAIALLFAILQVNPVPVCVLDEVDAALDEANVHRFARYLREFSAETQFLVITHRKGTMEQADALYGVSMEEAGVSKLVSVRLVDPEAREQSAS